MFVVPLEASTTVEDAAVGVSLAADSCSGSSSSPSSSSASSPFSSAAVASTLDCASGWSTVVGAIFVEGSSDATAAEGPVDDGVGSTGVLAGGTGADALDGSTDIDEAGGAFAAGPSQCSQLVSPQLWALAKRQASVSPSQMEVQLWRLQLLKKMELV